VSAIIHFSVHRRLGQADAVRRKGRKKADMAETRFSALLHNTVPEAQNMHYESKCE
jgi:hypothetical protein